MPVRSSFTQSNRHYKDKDKGPNKNGTSGRSSPPKRIPQKFMRHHNAPALRSPYSAWGSECKSSALTALPDHVQEASEFRPLKEGVSCCGDAISRSSDSHRTTSVSSCASLQCGHGIRANRSSMPASSSPISNRRVTARRVAGHSGEKNLGETCLQSRARRSYLAPLFKPSSKQSHTAPGARGLRSRL